MRSRNRTMEGPDDGHQQPTHGFTKLGEEDMPELMKRRLKTPQEENKNGNMCGSLSKKELLHLLGVMEGEVQVRSSHFHQDHR